MATRHETPGSGASSHANNANANAKGGVPNGGGSSVEKDVATGRQSPQQYRPEPEARAATTVPSTVKEASDVAERVGGFYRAAMDRLRDSTGPARGRYEQHFDREQAETLSRRGFRGQTQGRYHMGIGRDEDFGRGQYDVDRSRPMMRGLPARPDFDEEFGGRGDNSPPARTAPRWNAEHEGEMAHHPSQPAPSTGRRRGSTSERTMSEGEAGTWAFGAGETFEDRRPSAFSTRIPPRSDEHNDAYAMEVDRASSVGGRRHIDRDWATPSRVWEREPLSASEVMSAQVRSAREKDSLRDVASIMKDESCGIVPVVDADNKLIGVITDRDMVMRTLDEDLPWSQIRVGDVMSKDVLAVTPEESVHDVIAVLGKKQIRRVPVVDSRDRLLGMISLGDVATRADLDEELQAALEKISARRSFWRRLLG